MPTQDFIATSCKTLFQAIDLSVYELLSTLPLLLWLEFCLLPVVPNGNAETEFWEKEKKIVLLLCQAKGVPPQAYALKHPSSPPPAPALGEIGRCFYSLGVKK